MPSSRRQEITFPESSRDTIYEGDLKANPERLKELIEEVESSDRRRLHCVSVVCDTGNTMLDSSDLCSLIELQDVWALVVDCHKDPCCCFAMKLGSLVQQIETIKKLEVRSRYPVPFLNRALALSQKCSIKDLTLSGLEFMESFEDIAQSIGQFKGQITSLTVSDFDHGGKALESILQAVSCFHNLEYFTIDGRGDTKLRASDLICFTNFLTSETNRKLWSLDLRIPIAGDCVWAQQELHWAIAEHTSLESANLTVPVTTCHDHIYYSTLEMNRSKKKFIELCLSNDELAGGSCEISKNHSQAILGCETYFNIGISTGLLNDEMALCLAKLSNTVQLYCCTCWSFSLLKKLLVAPKCRIRGLVLLAFQSRDFEGTKSLLPILKNYEHLKYLEFRMSNMSEADEADLLGNLFPRSQLTKIALHECSGARHLKQIENILKKQLHVEELCLRDLTFDATDFKARDELYAALITHQSLKSLMIVSRKTQRDDIETFFKSVACGKPSSPLRSLMYFAYITDVHAPSLQWSKIIRLMSLCAGHLESLSIKIIPEYSYHLGENTSIPLVSEALWTEMVSSLSCSSTIRELVLDFEGRGNDRCYKDKDLNRMICRNRGDSLCKDLCRLPKTLWSPYINKHLYVQAHEDEETSHADVNHRIRPCDSLYAALVKGLNKEFCEEPPRKRQQSTQPTEN